MMAPPFPLWARLVFIGLVLAHLFVDLLYLSSKV
jgi:hypothetical protein